MSLSTAYAILFASIVCEIIGTSALHASQQFTRLGPSLIVAVCYAGAIVGLAFTFQDHPDGHRLRDLVRRRHRLDLDGRLDVFGQRLDAPGVVRPRAHRRRVVIVNAFSDSLTH